MTDQRRSASRPVIIGIVMSLLAGAAGMFFMAHLERGAGDTFWALPLTFVGMGLAGSFWWWRTKGSWSLAFILMIDLALFLLIMLAIVRAALFGVAALYISPVIFLLMFIGAKLGYWTRDYIEYRWGE